MQWTARGRCGREQGVSPRPTLDLESATARFLKLVAEKATWVGSAGLHRTAPGVSGVLTSFMEVLVEVSRALMLVQDWLASLRAQVHMASYPGEDAK